MLSAVFIGVIVCAYVFEFINGFHDTANAIGAPVSTAQVITTSIMGAGSAKRLSSVKWGMAKSILVAWVVTLPVAMVLGGMSSFVIGLFM